MSKQVLIEYLAFKPSPQSLNEAKMNPGKNLIVEGIVQRADAKNENGRVYPKAILHREVEKYISGPIAQNRALGELDHPESSVISLKNVCHNIKQLRWEGDDLFGRIEILNTPSGNILRDLILNNITVGISSRGMGSVKQLGENTVEVQDDFDLVCWDFVSTPSTHGAYMKPVSLAESKQYTQQNTNQYSKINSLITDIICNQTGVCCIK
jgi:hypothetical protein